MVPDIAKSGHSFKGAMAYYLHDKRQDAASPQPQTAERVAWTETRNLATDDPQTAKRIMIATAMQADQLKEAAGVKTTGRKSNRHVYAYSLAWHPDEAGALDRAEMIRAADSSLKALGADHLQALIVAHTDQKHPHVHVILNRVDPATGKLHSASNDRFKLSEWANQYERERGQILTPAREEKRQLRETFADRSRRQDYAAEKRQQEAARPASDKTPAGMLKAFQEQQRAQHRQEWVDLTAKNTAARNRIYEHHRERVGRAIERHKAETRPIWAAHFRQSREAAQRFETNERTIAGTIRNALAATAQQQATGQIEGRNLLAATFSNALSSPARRAALETVQDMGRAELSQRLKGILDGEVNRIKADRGGALARQRERFDAVRTDMIERQNGERAKIRTAWQQLNATRRQGQQERTDTAPRLVAERDQAAQAVRMNARSNARQWKQEQAEKYRRRKAQDAPAPMEQKPVKSDFDQSRQRIDTPKPHPTTPERVAVPTPQPSPSGLVQPPPSQIVEVPRKDWTAAAPATKDATPAARKDWGQSAAKTAETRAEPAAKDWNAKPASAKPAAQTPRPKRDFDQSM